MVLLNIHRFTINPSPAFNLESMTLQQFKHLRHPKKTATIWEKGEHIASRIYGVYSVTLWQIGNFYVEIHYDILRNKIATFESFESVHRLEPYLTQVDISDLFV